MILIDPPLVPSRGHLWSHLASDTSYDELHAFARALGIPERGFDRDHYDVPGERYDAVVAAGAVPVSSRELIVRLRDAGLRRRKRSYLAPRGGVMRGRDNQGPDIDRWQRKDWWGITLEAPDPHALLVFWSEIMGKPIWSESESGGSLDLGEGAGSLGVQRAEHYEPPVWPPEPGRPGMQLHLEVQVTDLEVAVEHALELGATLADHQPQDDVRVMLDPAGHPFCLYT